MEKLWTLKFVPFMTVPGNAIQAYFEDQHEAREVLDRHAALLASKPDGEMETLVFDDLLGRHCLRPNFFPYCVMMEARHLEIEWKRLEDFVRESKRLAGTGEQVGFKGDDKKTEGG